MRLKKFFVCPFGQAKLPQLGKVWKYRSETFLWEVRLSAIDRQVYQTDLKKFFLFVAMNKTSSLVTCQDGKPPCNQIQNQIVNISRKYLTSRKLIEIYEDQETGDLWWLLEDSRGFWKIHIIKKPPRTIRIIGPDQQQYVQESLKHCWTKKIPDKTPMSDRYLSSNMKIKLKEFIDQRKTFQTDLLKEEIDLFANQHKLLRQLKRKLKTFKKSCLHQESHIPSLNQVLKLKDEACHFQQQTYQQTLGYKAQVLGVEISAKFDVYKRAKRAYEKGGGLLKKLYVQIKELEKDISILEEPSEPARNIFQLRAKYDLALKDTSNISKKLVKKTFYEVTDHLGVVFLIGRSSHDGDKLIKSSRSNDFWAHIVAGKGAHIIVPRHQFQKQETLTQETKKHLAMLSIHHSGRKKDQAGEVYITERKYLKKKKNAPPGLWNVERAEVFFIRYDQKKFNKSFVLKRD